MSANYTYMKLLLAVATRGVYIHISYQPVDRMESGESVRIPPVWRSR